MNIHKVFCRKKDNTLITQTLVALEKKYPIIAELDNYRVFHICVYHNAVYIEEQCDANFNLKLTATDCEQLSKYFKDLSNLLK